MSAAAKAMKVKRILNLISDTHAASILDGLYASLSLPEKRQLMHCIPYDTNDTITTSIINKLSNKMNEIAPTHSNKKQINLEKQFVNQIKQKNIRGKKRNKKKKSKSTSTHFLDIPTDVIGHVIPYFQFHELFGKNGINQISSFFLF
eukprot:32753_1